MDKENRAWQWASHIIMIALSLLCVLPFILLFMASITDEKAIVSEGYSFFPTQFSFQAYKYLWMQADQILRAYGITVIVTVIGTASSLLVTSLLAYPLSRKDLPGGQTVAFIVFFTMLFNGGLVPTYMVYTQLLDVKNTLFALIVPWLLMNGFNVLLMRTFFKTTIPVAVLESASIDGAGEFKTYFRIVMPLSLPILATVGMFQGLAYWNDWNNGLVFVTKPDLFSLQNMLNRIMSDIQFLSANSNGNVSESLSQMPSETFRMAIAVIGVVPILAAYPFFQKYFVKGMTIGAVKG
ncbi:carbohydrate ABC transporter permease [Paenibacillus radicis (ex Gao et al. 2016)]|uniref:Sugar ABC transporter permease n=1 Tax=Paenibacillus radicis (ex Gao et al. 2016) TaxID=1737354 RepID=A0A917GZ84_9BACL|nr:carbohydrate ABC transporter permease [Paenibacillus radicis (ex Gao et al. 2016)]GGG62321.1 sugar ABC transporter permease [Paenibacillus radicis (ex Gao et al. 2016)]